jgi:UDP-GlcNAc3NAcA epimerase
MKLLSIVGARPQFIKAAVISRAAAAAGVEEVVLHTGQHFDHNMSRVFFEELALPRPRHHLGIHSQSHARMTGRMMEAMEPILAAEAPDWVLVYGDTDSTLAGALAAAKLGLPLAHVEAGLRSFNRAMPEEINRLVADRVSWLLLCPTTAAMHNLAREGVAVGPDLAGRDGLARLQREPVVVSRDRPLAVRVGDVMFDAARFYARRAREVSRLPRELGLRKGGYLLATIHRAENTDQPARLRAIWEGLCLAAEEEPVVWPVHPRTRAALAGLGLGERPPAGMMLLEPVGYLDMVALELGARAILTDSGGVQKEAFFFGRPCVTVRGETEWVELVEAGWNRLVPAQAEAIARAAAQARTPEGAPPLLYGDGRAGEKVVALLARLGRACAT